VNPKNHMTPGVMIVITDDDGDFGGTVADFHVLCDYPKAYRVPSVELLLFGVEESELPELADRLRAIADDLPALHAKFLKAYEARVKAIHDTARKMFAVLRTAELPRADASEVCHLVSDPHSRLGDVSPQEPEGEF
jgi:hypothetical protein